jgi:hypothetical protein
MKKRVNYFMASLLMMSSLSTCAFASLAECESEGIVGARLSAAALRLSPMRAKEAPPDKFTPKERVTEEETPQRFLEIAQKYVVKEEDFLRKPDAIKKMTKEAFFPLRPMQLARLGSLSKLNEGIILKILEMLDHHFSLTLVCKEFNRIVGDKEFELALNIRHRDWIKSEGMIKYIKSSRNLRFLDISSSLSFNIIQDELIPHLTMLDTLYIDHSQLGPQGAFSIANYLTELRTLKIGSNAIYIGGVASVNKLRKLRSLDISFNGIADTGVQLLAGKYKADGYSRLSHLENLDVSGNRLTWRSIIALNCFPKLRHLSIRENRLGDEGARLIGQFTELFFLDIRDNDLSSTGKAHLQRLIDTGVEVIM